MLNILIAQISEWMGAIAVAWLFSLSPRLKQPPVGFKYARRDGITALMLFGLILILSYVLYTINPPALAQAIRLAPAPAGPADPQQAIPYLTRALLAAGLALASFIIALVVRKQPVRSMGWNIRRQTPTTEGTADKKMRSSRSRAGSTAASNPAGSLKNLTPRPPLYGMERGSRKKAEDVFFPALQMGVAMAILTIFLRNRVMDVLAGVSTASLTVLLLAVGISLAEETIFRGYIQLRLSWWLGEWAGLAATAALFTLWHVPAWLGRIPAETQLLLAGLTFVQGLVLGWIMLKSRNVIAPALYRSISIWMNFLG